LRLRVTDPAGLGVRTTVELTNEASEYHNEFATDESGLMVARRLPFGVYRVRIEQAGFAGFSEVIEIRSAIPVHADAQLILPSVTTSVTVPAAETLIDPSRAGSSNTIGNETIVRRMTSLPGRSLQELIQNEPGWITEGNAVLHPRGSEYQTQFVVDGIPLTDNRSPGFAPEISADDVDAIQIYTAGIPAEFGRKMGGVVEVNTLKNAEPGWHGQVTLSGGSFGTGGADGRAQYARGTNVFGGSASGSLTDRYLNPVVPENYTNDGRLGDVAVHYEGDVGASDRIGVILRRGVSAFQIPNEQVQQSAGQRQTGDNAETIAIASYQHVFSARALGSVRGMVRDSLNELSSNADSTPVYADEHNRFREVYGGAAFALHRGRQEWKMGIESDSTFLHEKFSDTITDASQFPVGTPPAFSFQGSRPALEQSAYVQDLIRLGNWTVNAGLRWDHYQLLVNQNAVSPRLAVARYFPRAGLQIHASYDRIFQTPSSANLLLSSSTQVVSLSPSVLRLPVEPSHGNYFEIGGTKALAGAVRFDANYFRRYVSNFADDDQLLNTAVSFPIAFRKAVIYGAEGKIEIPNWHRFSGFAGYSYMVGNAWFPVTGGLFLADEAADAKTQLTGHFPDSQDQRNSARLRVRYQLLSRFWIAGSAAYGSGLPFQFTGTAQDALSEYGEAMVSRLDFARGRVRPSMDLGASAGVDIYQRDRVSVRLQADVENLNNRLNVIDFGGLFSGNAIAPPRSFFLRLQSGF